MDFPCAMAFGSFVLLMWLFASVFEGASGSQSLARVWADFRRIDGWDNRLAYIFFWLAHNTKKSVLCIWATAAAAGAIAVAALCGLDTMAIVLELLDYTLERVGRGEVPSRFPLSG